ncbi:hypothetical protein [Lacticaseibacillus absianus]|uniref:hypothetical protein n=1 Tax=Lacticaseibacillus absianus TaxID=2729623 RepID=UPI0015C6C33F|nr:hypothetical protein [Lacticaseibacillus absianus]
MAGQRFLIWGLSVALGATLIGFIWRYVFVVRHSQGRTQQRQLIQAIFAARALLIIGGAALIGTVALGQLHPAATTPAATVPRQAPKVHSASGQRPTRDDAVRLVDHYYAAHPKELKHKGLVVFQAVGTTTGKGGVTVQRIGGFVKRAGQLTQQYEFWVYPGSTFERVK